MKPVTHLGRMKKSAKPSASEVETRFLRLYSLWHETHDLSLRKKLMLKLCILMRRMPRLDLRGRFNHAF